MSPVIESLNKIMKELLQENAYDIKTFASMLQMFGNLLSLPPSYQHTNQILRTVLLGTRLLSCIIEFLGKNIRLETDVVEYMSWVTYLGSQAQDLSLETLNAFKQICTACIKYDHNKTRINIINAISNIS